MRRKIYLWDKADLAKMKQEATTDVLRTIQDEGIDTLWETFRDQLLNHIGQQRLTQNHKVKSHQPLDEYNNEEADSAEEPCFIKTKRSRNARDTRRYKKLKTACQRSRREAHETYVHLLLTDCTLNKNMYRTTANLRIFVINAYILTFSK